jgi:hypothetical protein
MRPHIAALNRLGDWSYTQTGYEVCGYQLERHSGNRWNIAEAPRSFGTLIEALDWVKLKVRT